MDMVPLTVSARPAGHKPKALRRSGQVPCILYGNGVPNQQLLCKYSDLYRAYQKAGESTLVDLNFGDRTVPVLFHEIKQDPVSDSIIHADFYAVDMKKEIQATVPVHFDGEAPAVKELGAILVATHDHVEVKCLPANLPHSLHAPLAGLVEFHDSITVADIVVPDGVKILDDVGIVIATVQEPRREVVEEVVAPAEGELAEGAAAAEGAAPAEGAATAEGADAGGKKTKS